MPNSFDLFKLPPQDLDTLAFCEASPKALGEWLLEQPLGQPKKLSIQLYTLLPQINQLDCHANERIELLDIMRPVVYQCVAASHETHLRQPLQLDKQSTRVAMMSHALLRHLCDGYLIAIKQALETSTSNNLAYLAKSFFFALHGLGQLYFHCAQLYAATTPLFWLKAHTLYQLAVDRDIIDTPITAYHSPEENRTIAQAYKRLIMLACSHTNQLPQVDIGYLFAAFEDWADMTRVIASDDTENHNNCRYWTSPLEDAAPHNRDQHKSKGDIGFDFTDALLLLQTHNHYAPDKSVKEIPTFFRHSLAEHLLQCWQRSERRKHSRQAIDERFEICVGLDNAYALLNGEWESQPITSYVNAIDTSTDGFCLRWQQQIPKEVTPGQCLLIRSPGKTLWRIGIIRWAQRLNQFTYAGIQLLSDHVAPTAAKLCWKSQQNAPIHRSIIFENYKSAIRSINLLLPKSLFDSPDAQSCDILQTDHGQEELQHLDKMAEFTGAYHFTCKISQLPSHQ